MSVSLKAVFELPLAAPCLPPGTATNCPLPSLLPHYPTQPPDSSYTRQMDSPNDIYDDMVFLHSSLYEPLQVSLIPENDNTLVTFQDNRFRCLLHILSYDSVSNAPTRSASQWASDSEQFLDASQQVFLISYTTTFEMPFFLAFILFKKNLLLCATSSAMERYRYEERLESKSTVFQRSWLNFSQRPIPCSWLHSVELPHISADTLRSNPLQSKCNTFSFINASSLRVSPKVQLSADKVRLPIYFSG